MKSPDWSKLSHAYGSAEDLPDILDELLPEQSSTVWSLLWERVCHQGTTYSASPYVLPRLLEIAGSWRPPACVMPLGLASHIVASKEFNPDGFEQVVKDLEEVARNSATADELSRSDRVYTIGAALVFAGDPDWGSKLTHLHDEKIFGRCPSCNAELYLSIGDLGYFTSIKDPSLGNSDREEILPCASSSLTGDRAWAHHVAMMAGDEELANRICCIFGQSVCTECRARFNMTEAIEKTW